MDRVHGSPAHRRGSVPYLRLVYSALEASPAQACPWLFTSADLMTLDAWARDTDAHGYRRVLVETGSAAEVPADGGYALLYAPGRAWATWGLAREGGEIVAWHCGSGSDLGRFGSMRAALESLPAVRPALAGKPRNERNSALTSRDKHSVQGTCVATGVSALKAILSAVIMVGAVAVSVPTPAHAKGCIKGALVGGVAGHVAHHGILGAAAGCAVGHHMANKRSQQQQMQQQPQSQDSRSY